MSEYDKQSDIEAEGQRAAVYYGKQRDIAKRLTSIADASKRANDTDIPLGLELRAGAAEIDSLRATISQLQAEISRYREALTPSATTKAAYIGEFHFNIEDRDEDGEECLRSITVPWTAVKEIMKAIAARAALGGSNDH